MNFNKEGVEYKYVAIGQERPDINILKSQAIEFIINLKALISKKHQDEDLLQKKKMSSLHGCIVRLKGILRQSERLAQYCQEIYNLKLPNQKSFTAFTHDYALFDFESMLFQARSLLDRITFYISKQQYNQDCDTFNKLKNVLENSVKRDLMVQQLIELIDKTTPIFSGLLIDSNNKKSLRSDLIHKSTIGERSSSGFGINIISEHKVIRFDHEIKKYPLMGSAWLLTKYITFFTLNVLSLVLEYNKKILIEDCEPTWKNNFIHFSSFLDPSLQGPRLSIIKLTASGFEIKTRNLKPNVLELAESF